jgi:Tol biopolymer transport system component
MITTISLKRRLRDVVVTGSMLAVANGCSLETTKPSDGLVLPVAGEAAIAWAADLSGDFDLFLMRPDGRAGRRLTDATGFDGEPFWAPDATRLVFSSERSGSSDLYILDLVDGRTRRLTHSGAADVAPSWSPDGTMIAFVSHRDGNAEIYTIEADGTGSRRLTDHPGIDEHPSWSADSRRLLFTSNRHGSHDVFAMDVADGEASVQVILASAAEEGHAVWSPDGEQLAYVSDESGDFEVYVQRVATPDARPVNVSFDPAADGFGLSWSPDGRHLVFVSRRNGNFEIYKVEVGGGELADVPAAASLTWSPDGVHVAILPPDGGPVLILDTSAAVAWDLSESTVTGSLKWSANGQWITFVSTAEGAAHGYIASGTGGETIKLHGVLAAGGGPTWAGDGSRVAYASDSTGTAEIYIARLGLDVAQVRIDTVARASASAVRATWPSWSPTADRIAYLSDRDGGGLFISRLGTDGVSFVDSTIAGPFDVSPIGDVTAISWSPLGSRLYTLSGADDAAELTVVNGADGSSRRWPGYPIVGAPAWAGEGQLLIVSNRTGDDEIYRIELPDGEPQNLSNHPGKDGLPRNAPALGAVVFVSQRDGEGDVYAARFTDGAVVRLTGHESLMTSLHWAGSTERLYFTAERGGTTRLSEHGFQRMTESASRDWFPAWSPSVGGP